MIYRKRGGLFRVIGGVMIVILSVITIGWLFGPTGEKNTVGAEMSDSDPNQSKAFEAETTVSGEAQTVLASYQSPAAESLSNSQYTVRTGDSLYFIARQYGVTINQLKQANGLTK